MSGAAVTSFFMAGVWVAIAILANIVTVQALEGDEGPEGHEIRAAVRTMAWTVGLTFAFGYALAGVGLTMQQPWGKAMAWIMMPWNFILFVPGLPIAIYQMVALPKHP